MNRMKLFALLLALVLLLFAGCSAANTAPETTVATEPAVAVEKLPLPSIFRYNGMDYYVVKHAHYPVALGAPELTEEEVAKLYGSSPDQIKDQINTVGDAFYYLVHIQETNPESYCEALVSFISGDYDDVGLIQYEMENNRYCLVYVKQDGMYYALDPFNFNDQEGRGRAPSWIYKAENGCVDKDLEVLAQKMYDVLPYKGLSLIAIATFGTPTATLPTSFSYNGMDYYVVKDAHYPSALGAPELTEEEVAELYGIRLERIKDKINTVGDAYYYLDHMHELAWEPYIRTLATLISGDYDDIGVIEYWMKNENYSEDAVLIEHQRENESYRLLYVKQDEMYYALDPFVFGIRPDGSRGNNWLFQDENGCADEDLQSLAERVFGFFPRKELSLISIDISGDPTKPHGAEVISPHGAAYPAALGQPKLNSMQIKELIAEGDYEKIAATINTLGDAINFCLTSKIQFYDGRNNNSHDKLAYVQSAWQVLKSNEGQCVSMSNLFHYLLEGDYDEIGYVNLRSPNSGHVINYILHDGMYYLVNPVDYTAPYASDWFEYYPAPLICCAEDFQTIADSIVQYMMLEDDGFVDTVHLVKSPGDCVQGYRGKYYPIGCEVIPYYGEQDITYIEAGYEWDTQTRIDY